MSKKYTLLFLPAVAESRAGGMGGKRNNNTEQKLGTKLQKWNKTHMKLSRNFKNMSIKHTAHNCNLMKTLPRTG